MLLLVAGCAGGQSFDGLAPAVDRGGPKVVFDLSAAAFSEIPFPNDVATRPDGSSPTGRRVNGSLVAPTRLEGDQRALLDTLDGFGTFAPISVSFDRDLDVADLFARQNDSDPANDAVYLVNLGTGALVPLDFGGGRFPLTLIDPGPYFANDPDAGAFNLLFPVSGPLANFLHPDQPHTTVREQADDLLTFYERSTHTLIARPVVPLAQQSKYAVVLTTRLRGTDGAPISSPHSGINHAAQTGELQPLLSHLPPGTRLEDIAYTWAFTTQSISRDFDTIRTGLGGTGPLQALNFQFRVRDVFGSAGAARLSMYQERGAFPPGASAATPAADFILPVNECAAPPALPGCLSAFLADPDVRAMLPIEGDAQGLLDSLRYVDYVVSGAYLTPNFLAGAAHDQGFQINDRDGTVRVAPEVVSFLLAVPKARPELGHVAPFPTVIVGHGLGSSRAEEVLAFGGSFAKFGLATIAIDAFGHGLAFDAQKEAAFRAAAAKYGVDGFADALLHGRARDLNGDGVKDPGGDFFTADAFHTRDAVRQSVIDWMQLVRLLRSFDGNTTQAIGDQRPLAGDFNADGIPDVAGPVAWPVDVFSSDGKAKLFARNTANPGSSLFVFGVSLGGILSGILPAVDPSIVAAMPASGAGGLTDVALRSAMDQVTRPVFLEALGPLLATCPFSAGAGACDAAAADAQPTLVLIVSDAGRERDLPVARLSLAPGQQVVVNGAAATADAQGQLRVPLAVDAGEKLQIAVQPAAGGTQRLIDTWELDGSFQGVQYTSGTPLTAPVSGFGLTRNTPELRRMMALTQAILDPADPVNYAPHWFHDLLPGRTQPDPETSEVGGPANVLVTGTPGDPNTPVSTAITLARAAGLVEMTAPDPAYGMSIDDVLVRSGVVEGVAATARFADPAGGAFALLPGHVRCDPGSDCSGSILADPSGYSCDEHGANCTDGLNAPRLDPPLREQLVRVSASTAAACPVSPHATGAGCWSTGASSCTPGAPGVSALMLPYLGRTGASGFSGPQEQKAFDVDQFMANAAGRFFECRGRELHFDRCQADLASCPWIPQPP